MKIAVLADIHGNLPALQVVVDHIERWRPDAVVVAGDIVNRGPRPLECLQIIQDRQRQEGWLAIRGNHEDYVIHHTVPDAPRSGPEFELYRTSYWTLNHLDGQVKSLVDMPFQASVTAPDGGEIRTVHASMVNNRDGIYPDTNDGALRRQIAPPPAALCVGHTHRPLIRRLDNTLVVNVGSVGMPFDGDSRAAYAQLTRRDNQIQAQIVRLDYARDLTKRDFYETGFTPDAGPLTEIMMAEFLHSRPYLHIWMRDYQEAVLTGALAIGQAVEIYLEKIESSAPTATAGAASNHYRSDFVL